MRLVTFRTLSMMAVLVGMAGLAQSANALPVISVGEGGNSLSDWGITLGDTLVDNTIGTDWSAFTPTNNPPGLVTGTRTLGNGFKYSYALEDNWDYAQNDADPLGPNQGGQNYDGEFMGVGIDHNGTFNTTADDRLVISVATGQRPDNGFAYFSPGDIMISTSVGTFGVEVGGTHGTGTLGATVENNRGTTYSLNSGSGTTKGTLDSAGGIVGNVGGLVALSNDPGANGDVLPAGGDAAITTAAAQLAGSVWLNPIWVLDPINNPPILTAVQMQLTAANLLAGAFTTADYYYSRNAETTQHAVIELAIDMSVFTNLSDFLGEEFKIFGVSWAPGCGNDLLVVTNPDLLVDTPEPTSMLLTGLGALGFIGFRRRQRAKMAA